MWSWRWPGSEANLREHQGDVLGRVCDLLQRHPPLALRAGHDVDRKYALKQPSPGMPRRRLAGLELERVGVDLRQQPQLSWFGRLARAAGDDLLAMFGVCRKHAVISHHMEARRRDSGHQSRDQIDGSEDHCVGAVPPRSLESIEQPMTIGRELEALLREWWPRNVPAQSLEPSAITTVDRRTRVHIDPSDIGERLVGRPDLADWMHELASSLAGLVAQKLAVADRRAVARRERGLVLAELVGLIVELAEGPIRNYLVAMCRAAPRGRGARRECTGRTRPTSNKAIVLQYGASWPGNS